MRQVQSTTSAPPSAYDDDFVLWAERQAALLRNGEFGQLDLEHLPEEIDYMSGSTRRELRSRLKVLIVHLMKGSHRPDHKTRSWLLTIEEQRAQIDDLIDESPSLRRSLPDYAQDRYAAAVRQASMETGLPLATFPAELPFSVDQLLDHDFFP